MYSGVFDLPWWGYVLVLLGLTHITIASVTIFLHRHQAHRALDLHPLPSHFFRFWLWLTTGMVTKEWAAVHRKHHAKCETLDDPHSPQIYGINRVLWGGVFLYVKEGRNAETLSRYGHGTPDDWLERHVYAIGPKLGILLALVLDVVLFGVVPGVLMWAAQVAWIPFWAAGVINGVGHWAGYRNFDCADASTNILPIGILIGGEELHNNHHAFATSAKLSNKWYEFDIGWGYIRALEILGLARVKKVAPRPRIADPRPMCDMETLQAVITNRYDVMARYMKSLRQVCGEEWEGLRLSAAQHEVKAWESFNRWLQRNGAEPSPSERQDMAVIMAKSTRLSTLVTMREELAAVWARSNASREQLVGQLQDWIARAEDSGIRQLQDIALRMRSYAPVPALA